MFQIKKLQILTVSIFYVLYQRAVNQSFLYNYWNFTQLQLKKQ